MNPFGLPWVELSILVPLAGAVCVSRFRDRWTASRWALVFTGTALGCAVLAGAAHYTRAQPQTEGFELFPRVAGQRMLAVDEISAPLLPLVALLHFLTALATVRTKMQQFSFAWSLAEESLRLAIFACLGPWSAVPNPVPCPTCPDLFPAVAGSSDAAVVVFRVRVWLLIGLLAGCALPPFFELRSRLRPTRVYALHLGLFVALLIIGGALLDPTAVRGDQPVLVSITFLAAVLVRSGTVPLHAWLTDLFENAAFGNAILFVAPLSGVYAAVRLVLPVAPDWVLNSIEVMSLVTAVYAASLAVVQQDTRRFCAYLFLSYSSLVLVGVELRDSISLTGGLCMWVAAALALGGFGLTLRALEARFGRLSLTEFRGLYEHSPTLAVCFLLTGLASVGFPGTLGFVASEILVDGAVRANVLVGLGVVIASAVNGIAVVRAYFLLFTGTRHWSSVSLAITPRERFAVLTLAALILGGGLFPQPYIASRHRAAEVLLHEREQRLSSGMRHHGDQETTARNGD